MEPVSSQTNVQNPEQAHNFSVTSARDSFGKNCNVIVNIESNSNDDMLAVTKYTSPRDIVSISFSRQHCKMQNSWKKVLSF